jgi:RNA polymerase sigma-70 factor (ECF subfamily)
VALLRPGLFGRRIQRDFLVAKFWWTPKSNEAGELWLDSAELHEMNSASSLEQKVAELFELFYEPVYRYVRSLIGSNAEAEDLAQEAFLRLHTSLQKAQPVGNVRSWIFRVAHNLAIDHLRQTSHLEQAVPEVWQVNEARPDLAPNAEQRLLEQEQHERLRRAMMRLSPQERYCLDLRAEGLSYREIAEVLGISISSVNTFLGRGVKKIAGELHE